MVRLYGVYIKTNVKVHESTKKMKEIDEREEREWVNKIDKVMFDVVKYVFFFLHSLLVLT